MYYDRPALPDARNTRHLIIEAKKGASHLCSIHAEALLVRTASLIEASNEQRDKVVWAHKVLRELLDTLEGEERRSVVEAMDYVHKCLVENQTLFTEDFSNQPVRSRSRSLSDKPSPKSHRSDSRSNPETDEEKIRAPTPVSHLFPPPNPKISDPYKPAFRRQTRVSLIVRQPTNRMPTTRRYGKRKRSRK